MHFPALIQDLAVILGVAALVTFIFRRIQQPVVLGYIMAGIIVGPYTPAVFSVSDTENIKIWAELGVIFLMFSLGLEFSFRRLTRVGLSAAMTACIQIAAMVLLGVMTANALGWSRMDAVFLGCMIAISSTTIIIKALEELKLNSKKFAELVYGILIVEDLTAILMLVALTNVATTSQLGGLELLLAGGKLGIVVGIWFVVGMFVVPRFVRSVSKHGNDEMLTVVAIGLCLALVALAARFHYSVALGAFIMGSILAESAEVKRIEHLVQPLRDIFGAVFFVSVGMLLDPVTLTAHWGEIAVLSAVIIAGKLVSVTVGAFATGQTIKTSVQTGFSMAQIGEFSFIIASLGLTYGVVSKTLYPIIVASSLVTTFTTPYLIKLAGPFADKLEARLPDRVKSTMNNYVAWVQRRTVTSDGRRALIRGLTKWGLNAVVVIAIFTLGASLLIPIVDQYFDGLVSGAGVTWVLSFVLSAPSIWAMLNSSRDAGEAEVQSGRSSSGRSSLMSSILTLGLVGLVSVEYFPAFLTLGVTLAVCAFLIILFRRRIGTYYRWLEMQFQSGFQADLGGANRAKLLERLAPWDAHLIEVRVPGNSPIIGKTLQTLNFPQRYGINVVVISRDAIDIVAPKASDTLYPGDRLLCFATDAQIERFRSEIEGSETERKKSSDASDAYELKRFRVSKDSPLNHSSIRTSGIRERFDCMLVGLERVGERITSPVSSLELREGDILWIVGDSSRLRDISILFGAASHGSTTPP